MDHKQDAVERDLDQAALVIDDDQTTVNQIETEKEVSDEVVEAEASASASDDEGEEGVTTGEGVL